MTADEAVDITLGVAAVAFYVALLPVWVAGVVAAAVVDSLWNRRSQP